jgi:phage gpG-like protein
VALNSTGEYALIGGPSDNGKVGAAWVFFRTGSTWAQQGPKLTGKEAAGAGEFGASVSLSEKGEYALIGAPGDKENIGTAFVFLRTGTAWAQQGAKLTGGGESGIGAFGDSVALSGEGKDSLMGGFGDNGGVGAAWVFTRSGTTWTQQEKLTGKEEIREGESAGKGELGYSVALSANNEYALIGGPGDSKQLGAAWVFLRSGTTWTQQAKLTAKAGEETNGGEFGRSVSISEKGEYALIGSSMDSAGAGSAFVFLRTGTAWAQQAKLVAKAGEETSEGEFGKSVSISATGEYALVGAPNDKAGIGAAFVFFR